MRNRRAPWTRCCWVIAASLLGLSSPAQASEPSDGWRIRFEASVPGVGDKGRFTVGSGTGTAAGLDDFDQPHPPSLFNRFVDVYSVHQRSESGWAGQFRDFTRYRNEFGPALGLSSRVVELVVRTDRSGPVRLSWTLTPDLDLATHFLTLTDLGTGVAHDLWTQTSYEFASTGLERRFRLEMTAGRSPSPIAYSQSANLPEDTSILTTLLAQDPEGDPLVYEVVSAPSNGVLTGIGPNLTYTPFANYFGTDSFEFTARDATGTSNIATVSLLVTPVNDAPQAVAQSITTSEEQPTAITLGGKDVDGDSLIYTVLQAPKHGSLEGVAPAVIYRPGLNFSGPDSFSFVVTDGLSQSSPALVSVTVVDVNDPPIAGFTVPGPSRNVATWDNNVGSYLEGAAATASTQLNANSSPFHAIDDNLGTRWASAVGQTSGQSLTVALPGGAIRSVARVRLVNPANSIEAVKHFEVRVSTTTADPAAFRPVLTALAANSAGIQEFPFPTPMDARFVQLRPIDNYGSLSSVSVTSFEVIADEKSGVPTYFAIPANVAAATEGGQLVSVTSQNPQQPAAQIIDGSVALGWRSLNGQVTNQEIVIDLAREKTYLIDRVRLMTTANPATIEAVKRFKVGVSTTTADPGAFSEVLAREALNVSTFQEFVFPGGAVQARFLRLTAVNNHGSTFAVSLNELQVVPVQHGGSSVSSFEGVADRAENLFDGSSFTGWRTAVGQVSDQFVKFRLHEGEEQLIDRIRLQTSGTSDSPREFEFLVSTTTDEDSAFTSVASGTLPMSAQLQEVLFAGGPARARYGKFVAKNNHGGISTRLLTLEAVTVGTEGNIITLPGDPLESAKPESPSLSFNGALVVRSSGSLAGAEAARMLDYDLAVTNWRSAGTNGQFAVIELAGGERNLSGVQIMPWSECCVGVPASESVRDFEVWVSTTTSDDAAFTRVLVAAAQNSSRVQTFLFPGGMTAARYVKYAPLTNQGSLTSIATALFEVVDPEASGVVDYSSHTGQYPAMNSIDPASFSRWNTLTKVNEWIKLRVQGGGLQRVHGVRVVPGIDGGAKDFEVRVSTTTPNDAAFSTVFTGTATLGVTSTFWFDSAIDARYVQFFFKNGHGASVISIYDLEVLRASDHAAVIIGTSGPNPVSPVVGMLDGDPASAFQGAAAPGSGQVVKLLLPGGNLWRVDQLALQQRLNTLLTLSPREFEVQSSSTGADDASFSTILAATLRNNNQLQFFSFPPVDCRYIRLLIKSTYGEASAGIQDFWVMSPQIGSVDGRFLDRSTDPEGGLAYSWSFGDGGVSLQRDPEHLFAPGAFDVSLTASDAPGTSSNQTIRHYVFGKPTVDFSLTPGSPNEAQSVTFSANYLDSLGPAQRHEWEFGDGTRQVTAAPSIIHAFADNGAYSVRLRSAGPRGIVAEATKTIAVANVPPSAAIGVPRTVVWGQPWNHSSTATDVSSTDQASLRCSWSFGDGGTAAEGPCSTVLPTPYLFSLPGVYAPRVTVRDKDGGVGQGETVITVLRRPTSIVLCAPQAFSASGPETLTVTATLSDAYLVAAPMAGRILRFDIGGVLTDVPVNAQGRATLSVALANGEERVVRVSFPGDTHYEPSGAQGAVRVGAPTPGAPDSAGTEFWLGFPTNSGEGTLSLALTAEASTFATISAPGAGVCQSVSVNPGSVTLVSLPTTLQIDPSNVVATKGIHVTALSEVTVHGLNRVRFTTDGFLALPVDVSGPQYFNLGYGNQGFDFPGFTTQFGVVAARDATEVTIRPKVTTDGHAADVPYSITLNAGQSYLLRNDKAKGDLTGTEINSAQSVSIFGGSRCSFVPIAFGTCDHLVEQLPASIRWGREFSTLPLATRLNGDTFRFLAAADGTEISVNGVVVATLNRGAFHERLLTQPSRVVSSKPILLAQYANGTNFDSVFGDPFMMLVTPAEQFRRNYTMWSPPGFTSYLNVIAPTRDTGSVMLDGVPIPAALFVPIPGGRYSGARVPVSSGAHRLVSTAFFGVTAYGFAIDESYGYPGGTELAPVGDLALLSMTPLDQVSRLGVNRCVVARAQNHVSNPLAGLRVDFEVNGVHALSGSAKTDSAGQAEFCYVGSQLGTDVVSASVGPVVATASKTWAVDEPNEPPTASPLAISTAEDVPAAILLTGQDPNGDVLSYSLTSAPAHGTLSGALPSLTYVPVSDYNGPDSFTFRVTDARGATSASATVSITVAPVNDAPILAIGQVVVAEDTEASVPIVATDVDGDALTPLIVTAPQHGTLTLLGLSLRYSPDPNYAGPDSFSVAISDGTTRSEPALASFSVAPVNDAPSATPQSRSTAEDTPALVVLMETDPENEALTFAIGTSPQHGTLSGAAPSLTYTPAANYHGSDAFTFTVTDASGATSAAATVSIMVTPVNDAPAASPQSVTTAEDSSVAITLTGTDPENEALTFAIATPPQHGALSGAAPNLTYAPAANSHGPDSLTFTVTDASGATSAPAMVSMTVTPVNDAPIAAAQSITTVEDAATTITLTGTDPENETLTLAISTPPQHGTLSGPAPNLTYTPAANYDGSDSFTFTGTDAGGTTSAPATVSITVTPVNDAPIASIGPVVAAEDTETLIPIVATDVDGDVLSLVIVTAPQHGTLTVLGLSLRYSPDPNYSGTDSFSVAVSDGTTQSAPALASFSVTPVNDAPSATPSSLSTAEDMAATITLAGADPENETLTFAIATPPQHGTLSGPAPNLTYTPAAHYHGSDAFTFTVTDASGATSAAATVSITVTPVNDAPIASVGPIAAAEDTETSIPVAATDADGDVLTPVIVTAPQHGTLTVLGLSLRYSPVPNYTGPDSFIVAVSDGTTQSEPALASFTITPVNDAPTARAQAITLAEDTSVSITLAGSDVEAEVLTFTLTSQPQHGTLAGTAPNLIYAPNADYNGPDSFTFTVIDASGATSVPANVSITVGPTNDAPSAFGQALMILEDTFASISLGGIDPDGEALTFVIVAPPQNGVLVGSGASVTYIPTANYNGIDTFAFAVKDQGGATSAPATVSITVTFVNDAPVANSESTSTLQDVALGILLTAHDVENAELTYSIISSPLHGTLSGVAPNLIYVPATGYSGPDSLTFQVTDALGAISNIATVGIRVEPFNTTNQPPVCTTATGPRIVWPPNHEMNPISILGVTDPEGGAVSIAVISVHQDEPLNGTGDGDTSPDATLSPPAIRAERRQNGNGRVYTVNFKALDPLGGSCVGVVKVCVAKSQSGKGSTCVDDGPLVSSTGGVQ